MNRLSRFGHRFGLGRAIGLLLLFVFLAIRYWDPAPLQELRLRSFDLYQLMRPRVTQERPVAIVDIDEQSLRAYGQWPWARTRVADLINRLTNLQSAAIGFDIVFSEPDRLSPAVAAGSFANLDDATRAKLEALPSNDDVLAAAIRKSRVVLGQSGFAAGLNQGDTSSMPRSSIAWRPLDPSPYLITFPDLLRNVAVLEKASAGRGLFSIAPERDGIVRRVPIVMVAGGEIVPALSLELLRVGLGAPVLRINTDGLGVVSVEKLPVRPPLIDIPTDKNGRVWVHFSPHEHDIYVSAKDVLEGTVALDRIAGKLILIGTSAVGLLDIKTTPVDPAMPGVEIHAQLLEAVLTGSILSYPGYAIGAELIAAFLVGIAIVILAPMIGALPLLILGAGVGAGLAALSWMVFQQQNILIDVTFPLMSSFGVYAALVFVNYLREQVDRQRIRSAFGQYLSPTLVEQLAQNPDKLVLGGEERTMTIMFSDVRGFTTISESFKDDPQGLTHLMNRLLTPMSNAIQARNGTIDKYMGDAIMAFWNAPLDDPNHEANACDAALDMLERLDALNAERKREAEANGKPFIPIKIGIGINTGRVTRRQHGVRHALPVHGAGRLREPRLAHRRPDQILRGSDPDRRAHRARPSRTSSRSSRSISSPSKARPSPRSSTRCWGVRRWPRRPSSKACRRRCTSCSRATGRRIGAAPSRRRRRAGSATACFISTASPTSTRSAFRRSNETRRQPTGTGCSPCRRSNQRPHS